MIKVVRLSVRIKRLKKALDAAWSKAVRNRYNNACIMCGKVKGLQTHHWLYRRARSINARWDVDNGACLCYYCHLKQIHQYSDKSFMDAFFAKMNELVPFEEQERLTGLTQGSPKWSEEDLQRKLEELRGTNMSESTSILVAEIVSLKAAISADEDKVRFWHDAADERSAEIVRLMAALSASEERARVAEEKIPTKAFMVAERKIIDDMKSEQQKLFHANSRLSVRCEKAESQSRLATQAWQEKFDELVRQHERNIAALKKVGP